MTTQDEPQKFGDYHLLEKIATGGMAEVWKARAYGMAGFEKILVIKKILDNLSKDDEFVRLFIDEARIAVQLLHANIVQVFELGAIHGHYYMAMEHVHGLDLARLVARNQSQSPLPIHLTLFVIGEVLKALQFAHTRTDEDGKHLQIVHCDISPQNILISNAGEVKITDFGISRAAFQAKSLQTAVRGKYAYMSPEQVDGKALDGRSDLFSLGIVAYELLTGQRLFKGKNRDDTLSRVRGASVPSICAFRPEVGADLNNVIHRALAAKPSNRYADAASFLEDLGTIVMQNNYRCTNSDLTNYVRDTAKRAKQVNPDLAGVNFHKPVKIVVLSIEAIAPPSAVGNQKTTMAHLSQIWEAEISDSNGLVLERGRCSFLVLFSVKDKLATALLSATNTAEALRGIAHKEGYRVSAGVAPGVARLNPNSNSLPPEWQLTGPFYLARWMMNLSAHRGRVLITEVGAKQTPNATTSILGRIRIQGDRYINLYELG